MDKDYLIQNASKVSKWDRNGHLDDEDLDYFKKIKLFAQSVPKKYGGLGFNKTQRVRVLNLIGFHDLSIAVMLFGHQALGVETLTLYGTEQQKNHYFRSIVDKHHIFSFALYEENAIIDMVSISTYAKVVDDGGKYYLLNGKKINVINASIADAFIVFALVKNSNTNKMEMSTFIVDKSTAGIEIGPSKPKLGIHACQMCDVIFKDAKVSSANVIGKIGDGYDMATNLLLRGRYSIVASLSGTMKWIIEYTAEFCAKYTQFGQQIYHFGSIEERLTRMAIGHYVSESIAYMLAGNRDRTKNELSFVYEGAMSKVFSSYTAKNIADNAMQISGLQSYFSTTYLGHTLRDIYFFQSYGQSNDMLRLYISLNGMKQASRGMKHVSMVFNDPSVHLNRISDFASNQPLDYSTTSNLTPLLTHLVHPDLHFVARLTSDTLLKFGNTVQVLLETHGATFIAHQHSMIRLADAAILCYAKLCCLSRCTRTLYNQLPSAQHEIILTRIFCTKFCETTNSILNSLANLNLKKNRLKIVVETLIEGVQSGHNTKD